MPNPHETATIYKINTCKNMRRFYSMIILPDLFGGHALHRNWGRIGTRGRTRIDYYSHQTEAESALELLVLKKLNRGYTNRMRSQ